MALNRYTVELRILRNIDNEPFQVYGIWDRHEQVWVAYYHRRQKAREYAWELEREAA